MVFKRNTLRNTRTFKQSTSINTSNINTNNISNKPPVKTIIQPTSVSQGRQNYNTGYTSDWRLKDLFSTTPVAYADRGDNFEKIAETDFKVDPKAESLGTYEELYNSPGGHRQNAGGRYSATEAEATPSSQEIKDSHSETFLFTPGQSNPDSELKIKDSIPINKLPWGHQADAVTDDGKFATMPQGATKFTIPDYIENERNSQYYKLGKNVSPEKHLGALNTQSLYKFENEIQSQWQGLVSNPSLLDSTSFRSLENKINDSNIPRNDKTRLIEEYKKKKKNYQKAAGGYGTDTPWSFGNVSSKTPNKAETIKLKLLSGEQVSAKEMKQYSILTGTTLGSSLRKADPNFGGYEQFL